MGLDSPPVRPGAGVLAHWSVRAVPSTNPRVIADDVWAKLLWAGLNLRAEDLPAVMWTVGDKRAPDRKRIPMYPLEMVRAVTLVWLFCALRSDEIRRLHVGCIRWQPGQHRDQREDGQPGLVSERDRRPPTLRAERQGADIAATSTTGNPTGVARRAGDGGDGDADGAAAREDGDDGAAAVGGHVRPKDAVCWLDVPVHKQGGAFTKPVDRVVSEAIAAWEAVRPAQPLAVDRKTGEAVCYLFAYRGQQLGGGYLNDRLIPLLCRKAGLPRSDARGSITSHRARSTIATQLFNAKEPLSLFELQEWLGHRSPHATQYYARITPAKLARSYEQAGYFGRNLRVIEVLIDREAVRSGAAAAGEPWQYFDLGHGYCTYGFFAQCPHRMACARCAFYVPKDALKALLLEAKVHLTRYRQEMQLTDEEVQAVDDGLALHDQLLERLADVPTPAGPTPRELRRRGIPLPVLPATPLGSAPLP
jgi:integrase